jgi:hypothetical protein
MALIALFAFAYAGCNVALEPNNNELKEGALTADLSGGAQYTSSSAKAKMQSGNILITSEQDIIGSLPDEIFLVFRPQTGSNFTVTPATDPNTLIEYCQTSGSTCNQYYGRLGQGTATITVTDITRDGNGNPLTLKGTFSGRLTKPDISDSVRTITFGQFNVRVQ